MDQTSRTGVPTVDLRILYDNGANLGADVKRLPEEIRRVLKLEKIELCKVGDRYGDFQVGGVVNPAAILAPYAERRKSGKEKEPMLRLILTGYDLRPAERLFTLAQTRKGVGTVVSTHRMEHTTLFTVVASAHGLFHQLGRVDEGSTQHDKRHPHHCSNHRCLMRPAENLHAIRRVAVDWERGVRLCHDCRKS